MRKPSELLSIGLLFTSPTHIINFDKTYTSKRFQKTRLRSSLYKEQPNDEYLLYVDILFAIGILK